MKRFTSGFVAKTLMVLWAGFWTFFVLASSLSEHGSPGMKLMVCSIGTLFFVGTAVLAFASNHIGGVMAGSEGIILTALNYTYLHNPVGTQLFLLLTLCLPPLVSGLLLILELGKGYKTRSTR